MGSVRTTIAEVVPAVLTEDLEEERAMVQGAILDRVVEF